MSKNDQNPGASDPSIEQPALTSEAGPVDESIETPPAAIAGSESAQPQPAIAADAQATEPQTVPIVGAVVESVQAGLGEAVQIPGGLESPVDPVQRIAPEQPTIQSVLQQLAKDVRGTPSQRYNARTPEVRLNGEQALLQSRLFDILKAAGVSVRRQGDVYPWLLDQVAKTLDE